MAVTAAPQRPARVVCLGEAMVVLHPADGGPLARAELLRRSVGGAEANVAGGLAGLGVSSAWVSRLGADPFGDVVADDLEHRGVRVLAERDSERPTGLYVKEPTAGGGSRMHYYRAGSAAAAMQAELLDDPAIAEAIAGAAVVHTSGITAGILATDSGLLRRLVELRDQHGFTLSVDLNWRPALWAGRDTTPLVDLLRAADVVLLGADEAGVALGAHDAAAIRTVVGARPSLVVKSDAHTAAEHHPDGSVTEVPALRVEVVEPVGAGDGFAAGYLGALVEGLDTASRLRQGHLVAAGVLATHGDHAVPPSAGVRRLLLDCAPEEWAATRVSAEGITSPALSPAPEPGGPR